MWECGHWAEETSSSPVVWGSHRGPLEPQIKDVPTTMSQKQQEESILGLPAAQETRKSFQSLQCSVSNAILGNPHSHPWAIPFPPVQLEDLQTDRSFHEVGHFWILECSVVANPRGHHDVEGNGS